MLWAILVLSTFVILAWICDLLVHFRGLLCLAHLFWACHLFSRGLCSYHTLFWACQLFFTIFFKVSKVLRLAQLSLCFAPSTWRKSFRFSTLILILSLVSSILMYSLFGFSFFCTCFSVVNISSLSIIVFLFPFLFAFFFFLLLGSYLLDLVPGCSFV